MIRIRHPGGSSTFNLAQGNGAQTGPVLRDLQAFIEEQSGIAPQYQELKTGYPPKSLPLHDVPSDTPIALPPLNFKKGEQIIVAAKSGAASTNAAPAAPAKQQPLPSSSSSSQPRPASSATAAAQRVHTLASSSSAAAQQQPPPPPPPSSGVRDAEVSIEIPSRGQHLTLKVVPDDNSCLFASVSLLVQQGYSPSSCQQLRDLVADNLLASSAEEWPDVFLGMPRAAYADRIRNSKTWGGAVELNILARHFRTQLVALDVGTGVVHRFGEGPDAGTSPYPQLGYLVYSGIHYDALALLPTPDAPIEFGQTLVDVKDVAEVTPAAERLVAQLKSRRYYTDTANFTLRCGRCGEGLKGEKEASMHASKTGHTDFREYE